MIYYSLNDSSNSMIYFCVSDNKVISILCIIEDYGGIYKISGTWTDSNFRNNGIMYKLLLLAVDNKGIILSDQNHTPDAKNFWLSVISKNKNNVFLYNISDGKYSKLSDNLNDIWNDDTDYVLGLKK